MGRRNAMPPTATGDTAVRFPALDSKTLVLSAVLSNRTERAGDRLCDGVGDCVLEVCAVAMPPTQRATQRVTALSEDIPYS